MSAMATAPRERRRAILRSLSPTEVLSVNALSRLTDADIASGADVSGDRNPIHLLPGRAAEAGLSAGSNEVVAHGLLLGAISLALVQSSSLRQTSLVFIGSADVPASECSAGEPWVTLAVDLSNGDIVQGVRPILRRR